MDLADYRNDPVGFLKAHFYVEDEEGAWAPIVLVPLQERLLAYLFKKDWRGRYPCGTAILGMIKKSGKSTLAAGIALYVAASTRPGALVQVTASSEEQAESRVFAMCAGAVEHNPALKRVCKVLKGEIRFPGGSVIKALPTNWRAAAGQSADLNIVDELWASDARELYQELRPPPNRPNALRIVVSHAGFEGGILHELFERGMTGKAIKAFADIGGLEVRRYGKFLLWWDTQPRLPYQTREWLAEEKRDLPPDVYARQIENRFTSEWESAFDPAWISGAIDKAHGPYALGYPIPEKALIVIGVDIGVTQDCSALVSLAYDDEARRYALLSHEIWDPGKLGRLKLEDTVVAAMWRLLQTLPHVDGIYFDRYEGYALQERLESEDYHAVILEPGQQRQAVEMLRMAMSEGLVSLYHHQAEPLLQHLRNAVLRKDGSLGKGAAHAKIDAAVALAAALWGAHDALRFGPRDGPAKFSFSSTSDLASRIAGALARAPMGRAATLPRE